MIKIAVCGIAGKMGKSIIKNAVYFKDVEIVFGVDLNTIDDNILTYENFKDVNLGVDVIIDFSSPSALSDVLSYARKNNCKVLLCCSGYKENDFVAMENFSKTNTLLYAPNVSPFTYMLGEELKNIAPFFENGEIEIQETHHKYKKDCPSGTAIYFANKINEGLKDKRNIVVGRNHLNPTADNHSIIIHSIRGGNAVGEHKILFMHQDEVISLEHKSLSKDVFALNALKIARKLNDMPRGFYSVKDVYNTLD